MAAIPKNRSSLRQADSNQTSAVIETHLIHLGAGTLPEDLTHCDPSRNSCASDLPSETTKATRSQHTKKRLSHLEH